MHAERALRFLAAFAGQRPPGREAEGDTLVEDLLAYLLSLAQVGRRARPGSAPV